MLSARRPAPGRQEAAAMTWEFWLTLAVIGGVLLLLISSRVSPDVAVVGGVTMLLLGRVLDTKQAFAGMANEGMLTVAVMYIVVAGLQDTGAVAWLGKMCLGRPATVVGAQLRLLLPLAALSAFMNNTPLVAMFIRRSTTGPSSAGSRRPS